VSLMIYVDDVDTIYPQAIAAGGTEISHCRSVYGRLAPGR
jgi:hypothetical protein